MEQPTTADTVEATTDAEGSDAPVAADETLTDELLVEEISIDGMCGVY